VSAEFKKGRRARAEVWYRVSRRKCSRVAIDVGESSQSRRSRNTDRSTDMESNVRLTKRTAALVDLVGGR
jgi:hypothetical protein